jgi:hypothetical protein
LRTCRDGKFSKNTRGEWAGFRGRDSAYGEDDVGSVADVLDGGRRDVDDYEVLRLGTCQ